VEEALASNSGASSVSVLHNVSRTQTQLNPFSTPDLPQGARGLFFQPSVCARVPISTSFRSRASHGPCPITAILTSLRIRSASAPSELAAATRILDRVSAPNPRVTQLTMTTTLGPVANKVLAAPTMVESPVIASILNPLARTSAFARLIHSEGPMCLVSAPKCINGACWAPAPVMLSRLNITLSATSCGYPP
jgi:hypothetical protein